MVQIIWLKCSVKLGRIVAHKNTQCKFFDMTSRKQTVQGECFMNERQPNSSEHKDCSGWQRRDTRLQLLMWPSNQRIGKDIRASSYFFTRRAADVLPEACFTARTEDRHDELTAMDLSVIAVAVALTPVWLVWILTVMPVWLYFSSFLFCSFLFLIAKLYSLYKCYLCLIFITVHKLAI